MGCGSSNAVDISHASGAFGITKLSATEKATIRETWDVLRPQLEQIALNMFMGLFEQHPAAKSVFLHEEEGSDGETDWLNVNEQIKSHGMRIMGLLAKILARIDDPDEMEMEIYRLGRKHVSYKAQPRYMTVFAQQFLFTAQPALGSLWTEVTRTAWEKLFAAIVKLLKIGFTDEMNDKGLKIDPKLMEL